MMMKNRRNIPVIMAVLGSIAIGACRKDKDSAPGNTPAPNEEELITTVRMRLRPVGGGQNKLIQWRDIDGAGGSAPVITADTLASGSAYDVSIDVLNESVSPADTITNEILVEGEAHQFFFQVSGADIGIAYNDADGNGRPIGLETVWTTGAASSGSVKVTLRHEPDKNATGVSAGDITNAGGETDIEVDLPAIVQ